MCAVGTLTAEWDVSDVRRWVSSFGAAYTAHGAAFESNGVNGKMLLHLTDQVLRDDLKVESMLHRTKILVERDHLLRAAATAGAVGSDAPDAKSHGAQSVERLCRCEVFGWLLSICFVL